MHNSNTSSFIFLICTVLTPVILRIPLSITSLQVGDAINLTCIALGGPRLVLQWLKDNATIASGQMGISVLNFALNTTDNCDFGNYTCIAMIDDMLESYTTLVIPGKLIVNYYWYKPVDAMGGLCNLGKNFGVANYI